MATTYLAKSIAQNKWFQVCAGNPVISDAAFASAVAAQFGVAVEDVQVVTSTVCDPYTVAAEMGTGTYDGLAVIAAVVGTISPAGRSFLKGGVVPTITGATTSAKLDRLAAVCVADPAIAMAVNVCNTYETLTSGDHTFVRKLWGKKKSGAQGGLSAAEVSAIEAAAPTYGITLP